MLLLNRQKPTTSGKSAAGTITLNSPLYRVCAVAGSVVMFIREPWAKIDQRFLLLPSNERSSFR